MDKQDNIQFFELGPNDFRPMLRNFFVGGAEEEHLSGLEEEHLSGLDDERTPTRGEQPAEIVTCNSPALSNTVVLTRPRGSGRSNHEPSSSKHNEELVRKNADLERDYMQRFNKTTLNIDNVPDTICLSALLHGLKPGRFLDDMLENPSKSWNEVNDRSTSFILSEDFQLFKRRADDKQNKEHKQPEGREEKKKQKIVE
ncbi:hypothetical protein SLEP1_g45327 [Rubroshorea leprosula]|uniref:Uncharacterized protein n=1 Tax=Rubroshorea leprosula TaxID=152421 RepID=A0AAV5LIT7_9ROSI|nr:hypothetical protein SLEP1_g45327 [Rubroshorea leprosula]